MGADARDFARAVAAHNPFRDNRVSKPTDASVDIGTIHERAFRKVLRAVDAVRNGERAMGITVVGPAGIGKSHLLGRLHAWATQEQSIDYVFLHNLQASPERMPRYLLKAVVHGLFAYRRGSYGTANLYTLLLDALPPEAEHTPAAELVRRLSEQDDPAQLAIYGVLIAFMEALKSSDEDPTQRELTDAAIEWLSGETIDEEVADALGELAGRFIPPNLADNLEIEHALRVFANLLASAGKSLVLCLDQIDNLDTAQVGSMVSFLHALLDHSRNLLVICSGIQNSFDLMLDGGVISEANWDRIAEERIILSEIKVGEARDIIAQRLDNFCEPFREAPEIASWRARDALFPLGEDWWRGCTGDLLQLRPRDTISWARQAWENQQDALHEFGIDAWLRRDRSVNVSTGEVGVRLSPEDRIRAVDEAVVLKLEALRDERERDPSGLPPDSDNIVTLTHRLLTECADRDGYSLVSIEPAPASPRNQVRHFDLLGVECTPRGVMVETRVLVVTARHATSVAAALRRLGKECKDGRNVLLVTDERRPLKLGARGQEHYRTLEAQGRSRFVHFRLAFAAYSQLDALLALLGQARVGDFELPVGGGEAPISEKEVVESYHRQGCLLAHPLLQLLLTEPDAVTRPSAWPGSALLRTGICGVLSWRTGVRARELAAKISEDYNLPDDDALLSQVIDVSERLRRDGLIECTEDGDDRYLWWLGSAS